jgi:hypothetical protein
MAHDFFRCGAQKSGANRSQADIKGRRKPSLKGSRSPSSARFRSPSGERRRVLTSRPARARSHGGSRISGTTARGTERRKSPVGRCPRSRAASPAVTSSSKAGFAREMNRSPASVRPTLRVVQINSAAPIRASSARTAWLIADGVTPSSAAGRELPVHALWRKGWVCVRCYPDSRCGSWR